jgi:hypothetical protein
VNGVALFSMIRNYLDKKFSSTKFGGLYHQELDHSIVLEPLETRDVLIPMKNTKLLITEIFIWTDTGTSKFNFKIFDKSTDGFCLYDTGIKDKQSDAILLPYGNKDLTNNLITNIYNMDTDNPATINIKVLGLELD